MLRPTEASTLRRLRDGALLACTLWLVLQNVALLALVPWYKASVVLTVASALTKAAITLLAPLWMFPVAAMLGVIFMVYLTHDSDVALAKRDREVRHG